MNTTYSTSVHKESETITILIVDDHPMMRQSLVSIISAYGPPFKVLATAKTPKEAMMIIEGAVPHVVLTDIHMPSMSGFELIEHLRGLYPSIRFLVFTASYEEEHLLQAFDRGAHGYLVKDAESAALLQAIEVVSRGYTHFPAELAQSLERRNKKPSLTPRELEVLNLIADGMTSKEIAKMLGIDHRTIETYRSKIRQRFGLDSSAALLRFAIQRKNKP